jgi:cold shock CspA family protein
MQGTIKDAFMDRGFGFIIPDDGGVKIFFHRSGVQPDTFVQLAPGQQVAFEVRTGKQGKPEAFNLTLESPKSPNQPTTSDLLAAPPTVTAEELAPATPPDQPVPLPGSPSNTGNVSIEDEPEEGEESQRHSEWGKVHNFDNKKGTGQITPKEGGADVFVHFSNIQGRGYKTLFPNEWVLFDFGKNQKGQECAVNVRPANVTVFNGKVKSFDEEAERGLIQPNEGGEPVVFQANGVLDRDLSEFDEGELVKYRLVESADGPIAVRVTRLDRRRPLESFADLTNLDRLLPRLAKEKAAPEEWNFRIRPLQFPYPILENYLFHTFKRIKQEEKIVFGKNQHGDRVACFNTGLATPKQDEIYAFFTEAKRKIQVRVSKSTLETEWVLTGFFREAEGPMVDIPKMPELASYFEGDAFKNLVFDHDLSFRVRREHCLDDRRDRFLAIPDLPDALRDDPEALGDKFDDAVRRARRRVRRNYKTAIPTFNRGKISLLLPLCIVKKDRADLALLVVRHSDYDKTTDFYIGWTVLTLDQAYNNARLLARPDTEWLTP